MICSEIGAEIEKEVDHLWCTQLHGCDDDRTGHELSMTVPGKTHVEQLIYCIHLVFT